MSNNFTWVPFFKEVHSKIHNENYSAQKLAQIANKIFTYIKDIDKNGKEIPIDEMSPINFIGYFNRSLRLDNKIKFCTQLKQEMNLETPVPTGFDGIPEFNNQNCLCMYFKKDRDDYIVEKQWEFSNQVLQNKIDSALFNRFLTKDFPGIGISYLSRFCYIVNPELFYPFDSNMEKAFNLKPPKPYNSYMDYCKKLRESYPNKKSYELSYDAYLNRKTSQNKKQQGVSAVNNQQSGYTQPLNQILYGPPGTGKTYNTILKAMSIIHGEKYDNVSPVKYEELKKEFDKLKAEGQIQFVTFHQSYSYEEFVEGIKPVINESNNIVYTVEDGIFKKICSEAEKITNQKKNDKLNFKNIRVFKMSLGNSTVKEDEEIYKYCIEKNVVALGYKDFDLTPYKTTEEFKKAYSDDGIRELNCFKFIMKPGDIIIISNGNNSFRAIAKIKSEYKYNADATINYTHFREVEWLYIGNNDTPVSKIYDRGFSQKAAYEMEQNGINTDVLNDIITGDINKQKEEKYVLIIDEINRGDISKIFGELITLIEPDKRKGEEHELKITLPYSQNKELFGVPKNLYIIGTMNTSDRSIASIDIALRRRFVFEEIMPDKSLVADFGIGFSEIFEKMNTKIKFLLDRDHQIGHSYFIKTKYENSDVNTLKTIWFREILPLLNEYFYCDWEKLNLIVPGFIQPVTRPQALKNECDENVYEFLTFDEVKDFKSALTKNLD